MAEPARAVMVDSDVVIDHLRGIRRLPPPPLAYSVITRCELFAGRDDPRTLRRLLAPLQEIALNADIAERGGILGRESRIPTPDALIAASAFAHGLPLMTRNRRHFERVPGLTVQAPEDLGDPAASGDPMPDSAARGGIKGDLAVSGGIMGDIVASDIPMRDPATSGGAARGAPRTDPPGTPER